MFQTESAVSDRGHGVGLRGPMARDRSTSQTSDRPRDGDGALRGGGLSSRRQPRVTLELTCDDEPTVYWLECSKREFAEDVV
jgi:hypothetical protein